MNCRYPDPLAVPVTCDTSSYGDRDFWTRPGNRFIRGLFASSICVTSDTHNDCVVDYSLTCASTLPYLTLTNEYGPLVFWVVRDGYSKFLRFEEVVTQSLVDVAHYTSPSPHDGTDLRPKMEGASLYDLEVMCEDMPYLMGTPLTEKAEAILKSRWMGRHIQNPSPYHQIYEPCSLTSEVRP